MTAAAESILKAWIAYWNDGGKLTYAEFAANHGLHV